jgi:AIPR protein
MSEYDVITLTNNFETWRTQRADGLVAKKIDPFEYFCVDQFLKLNQLTDQDVEAGMVGQTNDGGVDAFFFLVNQKPVDDEEGAEDIPAVDVTAINIVLFQIKEGKGFSATALDKLNLFTADLLDFKTPASQYSYKYHQDLIDLMHTFKTKFLKLAEQSPPITFDYFYITKLDNASASIHPTVKDAEQRVVATLTKLLSSAELEFHYIDAAALLKQVQLRPSKKRLLEFAQLMDTPEGYVGLTRLPDYYQFLKGQDDNIDVRLFESNVRGFQRSTEVNRGIRETLKNGQQPEFWLLNNGITILATQTETKGHNTLEIVDAQIVNGLQTSREVFSYFKSTSIDSSDKRRLLVRVVRTVDQVMREAIVYATNSQNPMVPAALRSTDLIHGHIEELFLKYGLFYDRRPGHHKDEGKPIELIVSIVTLLQAMVAVVLGKPHEAYGAPGRYIKDNVQYRTVFGPDKYDLYLFLTAINIQRTIDNALLAEQLSIERGDRLRIRFYVSTYVVRAMLEKAQPTASEIGKIEPAKISDDIIKDCCKRIMKMYKAAGGDNIAAKSSKIFDKLQRQLKKRYPEKQNSGGV